MDLWMTQIQRSQNWSGFAVEYSGRRAPQNLELAPQNPQNSFTLLTSHDKTVGRELMQCNPYARFRVYPSTDNETLSRSRSFGAQYTGPAAG